MPASESSASGHPSVPNSFSNNFWGKSDLGVDPLLTRMANAKTTSDELKAFYKARADLEEEYARKLLAISRKALGSVEMGHLRTALDVARGETEQMGKQHALIASQMRSECEEPLAAFAGGIKERRKIVQNGIDKLIKTKQQQTAVVNKCRDRYEQDCLRIKGYLAQGHMVMGQEERKNKAKLEKTQINMASNSQDYEAAVKVLEDTTGRWNKEWKAACDKFQDLEEERLDFTKSSLWAFANIASTVCVSDDGSCEKVRLALENCEVEKDIANFIKVCGTGQEIPDPPRYINFAKEDCDSASEASEDDYAVAQFPRVTNPAFRTASPVHEVQDPMDNRRSVDREMSEEPEEPVIAAPIAEETPKRRHQPRVESISSNNQQLVDSPTGQQSMEPYGRSPGDHATRQPRQLIDPQSGRQPALEYHPQQPQGLMDPNSGRPQPLVYRQAEPNVPPNYSPSQHGNIAQVPHNEYPTEGMTMYCRRDDQPSRAGESDISANTRPPSRDSNSDYSNPSSFTSAEPMSGKSSPTKQGPVNGVQLPGMDSSPEKSLAKRKSGFFAKSPFNANSPFRRKSKKEPENPVSRNGWNVSRSDISSSSTQSSPTKSHSRQPSTPFNRNAGNSAPEGEEPADPRASFQLNIGPNVLDVASPDESSNSHQSTPRASIANARRGTYAPPTHMGSEDPVAKALANLKQSSGSLDMSKRASLRQPVDAYHRVKTPAPDQKPSARPGMISAQTQDVFAAQRGTPPPAYEGNTRAQSALGVPQPAFTAKEMRTRTQTWGTSSSVSAPVQRPGSSMGRPASRDGRRSPAPGSTTTVPRAASPQPPNAVMRSRSPAPYGGMPMRAHSPAPMQQHDPNMRSHSPAPMQQNASQMRPRSPAPPGLDPTMRARSPAPDMRMRQQPQTQAQQQPRGQPQRPVATSQPRPQQIPPQSDGGRRYTTINNNSGRPTSSYGGPASKSQVHLESSAPSSYDQRGRPMDGGVRRERSKSVAAPGMPSGSHSRRPSGSNQYRSASPNPYMGNSATSSNVSTSSRPRSGTTGQPQQQAYQVQLAPGTSEMAMYEAPGTEDVSPSVCFMGKSFFTFRSDQANIAIARAMYSYAAAIPEELSFGKGDILAVLRLQDDGWWEAEVSQSVKTGGPGSGGIGLVPSNYLQRC